MSTMPLSLSVSVRGEVSEAEARYAREKVLRVCAAAPRPILRARVALVREGDPALQRPCVAKAGVDLSGRTVRAHVAAHTMTEAADLLEERLRRRLESLTEHDRASRHETGSHAPGEWRHGDLPTARPEYFPRPVEERRLVRRKSFALEPLTPEDAAWELSLLDHDFHLFTEAASGTDAVVFRRPDGPYGLALLDPAAAGAYAETVRVEEAPVPTLSIDGAVALLNAAAEDFVFFCDAGTGRGRVVYRRYDGHYGVVTPADEA